VDSKALTSVGWDSLCAISASRCLLVTCAYLWTGVTPLRQRTATPALPAPSIAAHRLAAGSTIKLRIPNQLVGRAGLVQPHGICGAPHLLSHCFCHTAPTPTGLLADCPTFPYTCTSHLLAMCRPYYYPWPLYIPHYPTTHHLRWAGHTLDEGTARQTALVSPLRRRKLFLPASRCDGLRQRHSAPFASHRRGIQHAHANSLAPSVCRGDVS